MLKTCAEPRCPTLVAKGETYCRPHFLGRRRAADAKRPSASVRGYDSKWRETRASYLRSHPVCQWDHTHERIAPNGMVTTIHEGCILPATDVHHLDGQGPKGERGHDFTNLQALCHAHHSQITSHEQRGGWNA